MYGYDYYGEPVERTLNSVSNLAIWLIISLVIAIIGGVVFYFLFIKNNKTPENKNLVWLKDFFNFKKMLIEDLLKITYLILAIFITLYSFSLIVTNFLGFLLFLILGNVLLRVVYEGALITIMIWKNTNEINKKMKK